MKAAKAIIVVAAVIGLLLIGAFSAGYSHQMRMPEALFATGIVLTISALVVGLMVEGIEMFRKRRTPG